MFGLLERFEKASGLNLYMTKTEAMWIGSLNNFENEPLEVTWKTRGKFPEIYITYDVQILEQKYSKQRKIKNTLNLWKSRGLSVYGTVNIIKTLLFPIMICVAFPNRVLVRKYRSGVRRDQPAHIFWILIVNVFAESKCAVRTKNYINVHYATK